MSFNRLVFAAIIVVILLAGGGNGATTRGQLAGMELYIGLALAVLGHIVLFPGISKPRRLFALLLDCGFLSWQLHLGGERAALFFPIYLWVIFGNGFRFGLPYLAIAIPVAVSGFGLAVATTPFWIRQPHLSAGLLIGLIILPAYAGTLIRKLSQATRIAEEASNAKTLFLASVSHELRTPLTAIIGMGGLLRASALDPEQREMVETVDVASRSLQSLIDKLLNLSRLEAGRMTSEHETFDLLTLLTDVRRMLAAQLQAKDLSFHIHVTPRTPLCLRTSRLHLQEILVNLAGNAVKFTASGGVVLAVDGEPVEGSERDLLLRVEISDTGIGIAAADQARIFENFTQANAAVLNQFGGTGLGLAITQGLVRLLGGEIDVISAPGQGSTFRFFIRANTAEGARQAQPARRSLLLAGDPAAAELQEKLAAMGMAVTVDPTAGARRQFGEGKQVVLRLDDAPEETAAPGHAAQPAILLIRPGAGPGLPGLSTRKRCAALLSETFSEPELRQALLIAERLGGIATAADPAGAVTRLQAAPATRRRRVLVVDDNRVNRRVFTRILEAAGHEVLVAENGDLALDVLEKEDERLDLVLMDINMPELDGLEATKLYRVMALGKARLPIIGLTADALAQANGIWRTADMDGCLVKPIAPQELVAAVESMARTVPAAPGAGGIVQDHPRFRAAAAPALDQTIIADLRQLGDAAFIEELMGDFLADAKTLIDQLAAAAAQGDLPSFRFNAHALRSSAANVGAAALGELCTPWLGWRGAELSTRAAEFASHACAELLRTQEAVMALDQYEFRSNRRFDLNS